jgi:hypothetical protein
MLMPVQLKSLTHLRALLVLHDRGIVAQFKIKFTKMKIKTIKKKIMKNMKMKMKMMNH